MRSEHWHLTEGLIFAHFAVFLIATGTAAGQQALALIPGLVRERPWTLVTYQFVHGSSMFWFFISMLVLWIMARPLEESWGSPRFLAFWLVATFGASLAALGLGRTLAGDIGFSTCLLFTFATLFPEVEFRLFFIIPVKVKYLAIVAAAILVFLHSIGAFGVLLMVGGSVPGVTKVASIAVYEAVEAMDYRTAGLMSLCFIPISYAFLLLVNRLNGDSKYGA